MTTNFKLVIGMLLGFSTAAYAVGNTNRNSLNVTNTNGSGILNYNTSGTVTVPNTSGTLACIANQSFSSATFTGTTTFPSSTSIDGSGDGIFGGYGLFGGAVESTTSGTGFDIDPTSTTSAAFYLTQTAAGNMAIGVDSSTGGSYGSETMPRFGIPQLRWCWSRPTLRP